MKYLIILLVLVTFSLTACGKQFVRDNPREQYRKCLEENPYDSTICDEQRDAYQQRFEGKRDAYHQGAGSSDY